MTARDAEMDAADIRIRSTPESRRSEAPHSGVRRRRGDSPVRYPRASDRPPLLPAIAIAKRAIPKESRYRLLHPSGLDQGVLRQEWDDFDAHLQLMVERGEASGPVVTTLIAFADQIRSLNGQLVSMHRSWCDEHKQIRDSVDRMSREVTAQADADHMRLIVQQFAAEVIPDRREVVRSAIDEQSVVIDERINALSTEVQDSVRRLENGANQLQEVVRDKHHIMHRSQADFKDKTNVDIGKVEDRIASLEARSSAGLAAMSSSLRASDDGADTAIANLSERLDAVAWEAEQFGKWATGKIKRI